MLIYTFLRENFLEGLSLGLGLGLGLSLSLSLSLGLGLDLNLGLGLSRFIKRKIFEAVIIIAFSTSKKLTEI